MPTFAYTAIEAASGRERRGTLESASLQAATLALKSRGLAPLSVADAAMPVTAKAAARMRSGKAAAARAMATPTVRRGARMFGRVITVKGLAIFTRQLATLVQAGMPLVRGLDVLARQEKNAAFAAVVADVADAVRSGGNFSDGLQRHPKIFDRLYVNMVKAGEAGGVLATVLERLARFMEKAEKIKGKVKAAVTYPAIVVLLAVGIVAALMVFVVPKFEQIFSGMLKGQPLPVLTQGVLAVSRFVQDHFVVSLGLVAMLWAGAVAANRSQRGRRVRDWALIKLPVLGELFLKVGVARFTRTFGTLLASGVPILQALTITRDTAGNVHLAGAIETVHDRVKEGHSVARPLEATAIFPPMVTSMIEVGEETGALPDMLTRIADSYDEEVDNAVTALTSLIEPFMIVFLALTVGTVVIALFLPIISIIQHLQ